MGTEYVKTTQEMQLANKRFRNRVKLKQKRIIQILAETNLTQSIVLVKASKVSYSGDLLASIKIPKLEGYAVRVMAVDYGVGGKETAEIEHGLKEGQSRTWVAPLSVLDAWRRKRGRGTIGKKDVDVSPSMGGIPHPIGVHYMEEGYKTAKASADSVIRLKLGELN